MGKGHTPLPPVYHGDGTASIPLQRRGEVVAHAVVDGDDAERLSRWGWGLHHEYAVRSERRSGRFVNVRMHRDVLGLDHGTGSASVGDHIDGNRLDNRRANLRHVTNAENGRNRRGTDRDSGSGVRNVRWDNGCAAWKVRVTVDGRLFFLGNFTDLHVAARVAECGRLLLHGTADGSVAPTFDATADPADVRAAAHRMAGVGGEARAA